MWMELASALITRFEAARIMKFRQLQAVLHAMKPVMVVIGQVNLVVLRVRMAMNSMEFINAL